MTQAFLFDLDGTLVDSERENADSIARVLGERGRPLSEVEREFVVGHGWREIYDCLVSAGGVDLTFEQLKDMAAAEKERLCEREGLRELPGAVDFVRRAATRGACAVVSGSSRREIAWCLARLGIADLMAGFIGAEDVRRGKPSPEGYLMASALLRVPPSSCLVFEDSQVGIAAARSAGMRCVALAAGNFLGQDQSQADLRAASFLALGDRLWKAD